MATFDRFDICEAHLALENDYHSGGWLQERPSNQRRKESTDVQLSRIGFKPGISFNGFQSLSDNGKEIYAELERRYGLLRSVVDFEVLDHGEDGSQYFPGCSAMFSKYQHCVTGVGDTAAEALEDAAVQMAMNDHHLSDAQYWWAKVAYLSDPEKSAFESLDHSECDDDHSGDDWNHYVSIRYTLRGESEGE